MKGFLPLAPVLLASICLSGVLRADEKNGVSVTVQKTTLEKADTHNLGLYYNRIDRTQGLKATIKNVSFKDMKEGELVWQILVRKYYTPQVMSYSGTEKIKPLKPAESQELTIGAAEVTGWKDGTFQEKDKIEWQVVVKQDGNELIRAQSTTTFDQLAKHAYKAPAPNQAGFPGVPAAPGVPGVPVQLGK